MTTILQTPRRTFSLVLSSPSLREQCDACNQHNHDAEKDLFNLLLIRIAFGFLLEYNDDIAAAVCCQSPMPMFESIEL